MGLFDLMAAQLSDPFRIGILIALAATMLRTRQATGVWRPLAAGAVFVAVLIPITLQAGQGDLVRAMAVGLLSNAVLLAAILGLGALVLRVLGR